MQPIPLESSHGVEGVPCSQNIQNQNAQNYNANKSTISRDILLPGLNFHCRKATIFPKNLYLQNMNNFVLFPFNKLSVDRPYTFFRFKLEQTFFKIRQGSRLFSYSNLVEQDSIIVYMLCVLY